MFLNDLIRRVCCNNKFIVCSYAFNDKEAVAFIEYYRNIMVKTGGLVRKCIHDLGKYCRTVYIWRKLVKK